MPPSLAETGPRSRTLWVATLLFAANAGAWLWASLIFRHDPLLLGSGALAYCLGLRHAVDADHIAVIDNVTRKLMYEGKQPVAVGLFFALGHSTVVMLVSLAIATTAASWQRHWAFLAAMGSVGGPLVSATFLLTVALTNASILIPAWRDRAALDNGFANPATAAATSAGDGGLLGRLYRPAFRLTTKSWHMYPIGFLFGLGFDTSTEIALIGIAATQTHRHLPAVSIMVFPVLFTAGMSLIDTADGILMQHAYRSSSGRTRNRQAYTMTMTLISIAAALFVGGTELLGFAVDRLGLRGGIWDSVGAMNDHSLATGFFIVALFAAAWAYHVGRSAWVK